MKILGKWLMIAIASFSLGVILGNHDVLRSLAEIRSFLESISAVIWAGIISACVSIYGVTAANKSSLNRLHEQHKKNEMQAEAQRIHDAEQKDRERKAAIRREVYLDGVTQAHAILEAIGSILYRPIDDTRNDSAELQSFLKANSKVWLVSNSEAAILTRVLAKQATVFLLGAQKASIPYRLAAKHLQTIELETQFAESEVKRIEAWNKSLNEHGSDGIERLKASVALLDAHNAVNVCYDRLNSQRSDMQAPRMTFVRFIQSEMWPFQESLVKLVSALRLELGLEPALEQFVTQMEESRTTIDRMLNSADATT